MNHLLAQLSAARREGYSQGVVDGKEFALSILTVVLNDKFGFAGKRIAEINDAMQDIWDTEFKEDPESGARHLVKRLNQIKGIEVGKITEEVKDAR